MIVINIARNKDTQEHPQLMLEVLVFLRILYMVPIFRVLVIIPRMLWLIWTVQIMEQFLVSNGVKKTHIRVQFQLILIMEMQLYLSLMYMDQQLTVFAIIHRVW